MWPLIWVIIVTCCSECSNLYPDVPTTDQTNTSHSSDYRGLRSRTTSQYRKWISETLHRPRHWSRSQLLIALSISITWILSPTPQITFYITMHSWNSSMLMSTTRRPEVQILLEWSSFILRTKHKTRFSNRRCKSSVILLQYNAIVDV